MSIALADYWQGTKVGMGKSSGIAARLENWTRAKRNEFFCKKRMHCAAERTKISKQKQDR
jgi:hypothetical protein